MSYFTDRISEFDNFLPSLGCQCPTDEEPKSAQNFMELHNPVVSNKFTPMLSTSLYHTAEQTDSLIDVNMSFEDISAWAFSFDNTANDTSASPTNQNLPDHAKSLSIQTTRTCSSLSEPESETPSNLSPVSFRTLSPQAAPSFEQNKRDLPNLSRIERRREKNRNSQRNFRKRKEQYVRDLERQFTELQKRYDVLLRVCCWKDKIPIEMQEKKTNETIETIGT